jgi:hypothetical protein
MNGQEREAPRPIRCPICGGLTGHYDLRGQLEAALAAREEPTLLDRADTTTVLDVLRDDLNALHARELARTTTP